MSDYNSWIVRGGKADGMEIFLLTLEEFNALPFGTQLIDIFGEPLEKTAKTDTDTRGGFVAYGRADAVKGGRG